MRTFTRVIATVIFLTCSSLLCSAKVDTDVNITVGGKSRKYKLYVPNNVKQNTALVFCLHGTGGSSDNRQPNFDGIADSEGIIVVRAWRDCLFPILQCKSSWMELHRRMERRYRLPARYHRGRGFEVQHRP